MSTENIERKLVAILHADVKGYSSHGDWIRLFRRSGFEIEELVAVRPEPTATTR